MLREIRCPRSTAKASVLCGNGFSRPFWYRPKKTNAKLHHLVAPATASQAHCLEQDFATLSGLLCPDARAQAGDTPLGRGLLIEDPSVARGSTLLSVDCFNTLCITDEPTRFSNSFGAEALQQWQQVHGQLPPLLNSYLLSSNDWFLRMVAWLLWVRGYGTGIWALYARLLPQLRDVTCLMAYTPDERSALLWPELQRLAEQERNAIQGIHECVFSSTTGDLRALQLAHSLDDTVWAAAMVNSRTFSDAVGQEAVSMMVPLCDMANHLSPPNAAYALDAAQGVFRLVAQQDLPAGQEVCISYLGETSAGHGAVRTKDNMQLMRDYGFVLPGNPADRLVFEAGDDVYSSLLTSGSSLRCLDEETLQQATKQQAGPPHQTNRAPNQTSRGTSECQGRRSAVHASMRPLVRARGVTARDVASERRAVVQLLQQCQHMLQSCGVPEDHFGHDTGLPRWTQAAIARQDRTDLVNAAKSVLHAYLGILE